MYIFPNQKKYIGKTKHSMARRQKYDWSGYERCTLLWKAIQKYGTENIKTEILFEGVLTDEEASEMERFYIAKFKTNACRYSNPSYGYNLTDGGEGVSGWKPSGERLRILQNQMKENGKKRKGKKASEETRARLSKSHMGIRSGYVMPEETKKKISVSNSLKNISEETRKRKSIARKKQVMATNKENGMQLIFNSREQTADYFGVKSSTVTRWIDGTRNPSISYTFKNYPPTTTKRVGVA